MDKVLEITLLYDFYGELLTEKQRSVIELYYLDDYSLNEIGDSYGITRQAVHELIKRTEKILQGYEAKLMLVDKFLKQKERQEEALRALERLMTEKGASEERAFIDLREKIKGILD